MKYYGEHTQKLYDTIEACQNAEKTAIEAENRQRVLAERKAAEEKEKKEREAAERKAMAAEVTNALKAMNEAQKVYREKLQKFINTYGTYHFSSSDVNDFPSLFNFFNWI